MAGVTTANRCDGIVDYWRTPGCSGPDPFLPRMKPAGVSSSSGPGPSDKGLSHNRLIRAGCSSTPTPTRTSSPEGMTCPTTHQAPRLARPLSLTVPNAMANSSYPTWAVATVDRGRQKHNRGDKTRQPRGDGQRERWRTSAANRRRVDDLSQLEDVVGRHLVRFGERDELTVRWERDRAASTPPDSQYISRTNESRKVVISAAPNGGS